MKILLAGPDHEENLSIRYLSASLLAAGHDTTLAAFNSTADMTAVSDAAESAGIVGLSMCFQSRAEEFLQLARLIKSRDPKKLVVAGGHYATCGAAALLANHPEIDIIVIHEGERTLVEIANALLNLENRLPEIPGVAYRSGKQACFSRQRPMLDDLDALPFPDRRGPIHTIAGVPSSYLMGSRGCYSKCAYCCITTLHANAPGKRFRQRNVERITDEMAVLYHERGTRQFIFHDDNFLVPSEVANHARLAAFEKALKQHSIDNIALVIKCRPADASKDVLRRLKELGLVRLFLGIESATPRGLSALERNQTVEDSERALEACAALDISAQFTLMIFNPDATLDTLRSDVDFMRRYCGNPLNFCRAEIYAGTPLEKRMIALGRARGNYLARVYSLSDPAADFACNISLDLFQSRCWSNGSLMQKGIGLDHMAAVARRFYPGQRGWVVCQRVANWLRSMNLDTVNLLDEVIGLSASCAGSADAGFQRAILALKESEAASRQKLLAEGLNLRAELESLRFRNDARRGNVRPAPQLRFAKQAAAALLAIGMPTTAPCQPQDKTVKTSPPAPTTTQYEGISEMAAPPLIEGKTPLPVSALAPKNLCSLAGKVQDSSGAVVRKATIIITNLDTGPARVLTVDEAGQYVANDLPKGRYAVRVQAPGFGAVEKTEIAVNPGDCVRVDFLLQVYRKDHGCCEYAALPLKVPVVREDLSLKKKPFSYVVGDNEDHNSFRGIAKLVYGDAHEWVQIFEANRIVIERPGFIPDGTSIWIPPRKRAVPKLISKVTPVYPPEAVKGHIWGDVVLDVTLKADGTVERVGAIDGNPLLVDAATGAVKQWRYQAPSVKGSNSKFVVAISFTKAGKVQ